MPTTHAVNKVSFYTYIISGILWHLKNNFSYWHQFWGKMFFPQNKFKVQIQEQILSTCEELNLRPLDSTVWCKESKGLRFDSSQGRIFSLSHTFHKMKKHLFLFLYWAKKTYHLPYSVNRLQFCFKKNKSYHESKLFSIIWWVTYPWTFGSRFTIAFLVILILNATKNNVINFMYPHSEDLCLFLKRSNTPSCYNLAKEKSKKKI